MGMLMTVTEKILGCLESWEVAMTAEEIADQIGERYETTAEALTDMDHTSGLVVVVNKGRWPQRYAIANPDSPEPPYQIVEDVWDTVAQWWTMIFDVHVTADDAELMVRLANRGSHA